MTLSEFKAWFEGFTETLEGPPDAKQWKRIQARVKEITGNPITERVYIDRYRDWVSATPRYGHWTSAGCHIAQNGVGGATLSAPSFDGATAMANLGRAEAAAIAS